MTDHEYKTDDLEGYDTQRSTLDPLVADDDLETGWALLKDTLYQQSPAGIEIERRLHQLRDTRDDRQLKRIAEMDAVRLSSTPTQQKEQRIREIRRDAAEDKELFHELWEPLVLEKEHLYASLKANYFDSRRKGAENGID